MDDLLQEFIAETRETLEALAGEIVMWEADPSDRNRLDSIFRFVHTVKGSCGFLDLPRLSRLSHAAEDVLAAVRSGERAPDTALVNAVLAIVDRIGEIIEAIDAGAALDDSGEELLIAALNKGAEAATSQSPSALVCRAPTRSVRLSVDLLDRMMSGMSDMVLARNELARRLRYEAIEPAIEAALDRLSLTVAEMRDTVTRTRMQKIEALFSALPRMVRDTAAELGKAVTLTVDGSDVELDREMIEMMRDPLVHIVRNSIDHGIESLSERRAAGKRDNGRLTVSARQSGNQIIIEVVDDGRGIDVERLITKMAESGARSEAELRALPDNAKLELVFEPGLSSKNVVTSISGRGVGMDVVRANIEQIGGRVALTNMPGRGLRLTIHVPLTLSIISTIVLGAAGQRFAISRQAIEEIVRVRGDAVRIDMLGDTPVATVRGRRLPLISLASALGLGTDKAVPNMLAIVSVTGGSYALSVDEVLDTEELVVKPATPAVMACGLYAGQTLPDNGRPMLLLDSAGLAAASGLQFSREVTTEEDDAVGDGSQAAATSALLFLDLDGTRRAVPLAVVDRVELVDTQSVRFAAGQLRLLIDDALIPLTGVADCQQLVAARAGIAVLRIADGRTEIGYAIAEALDIVTIDDSWSPARTAGPVAGVMVLEGEQIEVLDIHWLFATNGRAAAQDATQPVCLLTGASTGWMDSFLRPVLQSAGYRVVTALPEGVRASVMLAMADDLAAGASDAPVVKLRQDVAPRSSDDDSIYRYDRAALLAALSDRSAGARG